ncbi:TetR family transcriptional regulator [Oryzobacter terrae]|uniref:TetR family transcriptional regulator n=1 Tax=Oryzobacter terrae TaxID=1620385 RepID=UPI00366D5064
MSQAKKSATRSYTSAVRSEQADATRSRVVAVADALFRADGYAATSVAAVARAAGVSSQTVYNVFGTKAALLKAAYDVAVVGDDEPVPLAERPDVRALYAEPDAAVFLRGYAAFGRHVAERVGPLALQISAGAASGDADLLRLRDTTNAERLVGAGMVAQRVADLGALAPGLGVDGARDRIWTLNSIEVWHLLTALRGWSGDEYAAWVGDAMVAAALAPG